MYNIKILQLITGLDVGGAEKVVFDLSRSLKDLGHEVFVIGISDKDNLKYLFEEENINVSILNVLKTFSSFLRGCKELFVFIKEKDIRIIHVHMAHALIMALMVKIFRPKLKIVFTSHNFNIGSKTRELIVNFSKHFRDADIIFSASMWKNIYKKNAYVIPNGIDVSKYETNVKKNEIFTFLCIGRIEPVKNHKFLVDIAVRLEKEFDFEIHIVGEGFLKQELIDYIVEKNVKSKFKLLGYRKDINIICNRSHVFILPSLWEGLPISLLEAAASGIPVISTAVGSIPELIDENSGYLTDLDFLYDKMKLTYYNYNEALKKAGLLKRKIKEKYSLTFVVDEHIRVYKKLLNI
ncbi:hypothetical protein AR687_00640 [Flavobacteriaceae bacterium CRH]|nr:hypothetical protein AR687_00640 [Flavobacteriaceae bacterium CRH]